MIVVFYGKRNSGKTTICREFYGWVKKNLPLRCHYLDSDKLRFVYALKGFAESTERALIEKAMEIAHYEESLNDIVLVSLSFAYADQREKFESRKGIMWVYLNHEQSKRPSNKKEIQNFDEPKKAIGINTTDLSIEDTLLEVVKRYKDYCSKN